MNRFVLKNTFIKVYIYYFFPKYFYKNNKSKLDFRDRYPKRFVLWVWRKYNNSNIVNIIYSNKKNPG